MRLFMTKTAHTGNNALDSFGALIEHLPPFHSKILLFLIDFLISSYSRFLIPPRPPTYSMTFGVARGLGD